MSLCQDHKRCILQTVSLLLINHGFPFFFFWVLEMAGKVVKSDVMIVKNVYFIGEQKNVSKKRR